MRIFQITRNSMSTVVALCAMTVASCAPVATAQVSPIPSDYPMFDTERPTTTVTIGASTMTPETLTHQPNAQLSEFPYAPGSPNTRYFYGTSIPATLPPYAPAPASHPPLVDPTEPLLCLSDGLVSNFEEFNRLTDRAVTNVFNATTYQEMTNAITLLDDDIFDFGIEYPFSIFCPFDQIVGPTSYSLWWNGQYADEAGSFCSYCGRLNRTDAPEGVPSYAEASGYFDAVAVFREKMQAIQYNMFLELNSTPTGSTFWVDIHTRAQSRIDLAYRDFAFDLAAEWWDLNY